MSSKSPDSISFLDDRLVNVNISAGGGVSELRVVNGGYALMGTGVGNLNLSLAPGHYKLMQRVGDSDKVSDFLVPKDTDTLDVVQPALEFASPVPLPGTTLYQPMDSECLDPSPSEGSRLRILVRTPRVTPDTPVGKDAFEHLRMEVNKLKLETIEGEPVFDFAGKGKFDEAGNSFTLDEDVGDGFFVLVQALSIDRQRCTPLFLKKDWDTQLFMLALWDNETTQGTPISLDKSAMAIGTLNEHEYLRLEGARKTLAAGRAVPGWGPDLTGNPTSRNPVLQLIEAHLRMRNGEIEVGVLIKALSSVFGNGFPDVLALKYERAARLKASEAVEEEELQGPPLLRRSWDRLLEYGGNEMLARIMPFDYQVENSSTWFVWTEALGARRSREIVRTRGKRTPLAAALGTELDLSSAIEKWSPVLMPAFSVLRDSGLFDGLANNALESLRKRLPERIESELSIGQVVKHLAQLVEQNDLEAWLREVNELLDNSDTASALRKNPSVRQLISALSTLLDKTLIKAIGAEQLVRQVLRSLRLPDDDVVQLVRRVAAALYDAIPDDEKTKFFQRLMAGWLGNTNQTLPPTPADGKGVDMNQTAKEGSEPLFTPSPKRTAE